MLEYWRKPQCRNIRFPTVSNSKVAVAHSLELGLTPPPGKLAYDVKYMQLVFLIFFRIQVTWQAV
jgi:hypothetical protein